MHGLRRTQSHPQNNPNMYDKRNSDAESVYNAELVPPATSYATVRSGLSTPVYRTPTIGPKVRAFFKNNKFRSNGLSFMWAWGANNMGKFLGSTPGSDAGLNGMVRSSKFQTALVQLHDWQLNSEWYIAWNGTGSGMFNGSKEVRYQYPSFRVSQINTRTSGGPGPIGMRMQPRPRFTAVQRVPKYTAAPRYYDTSSAPSGYTGGGGSSSANGPGKG